MLKKSHNRQSQARILFSAENWTAGQRQWCEERVEFSLLRSTIVTTKRNIRNLRFYSKCKSKKINQRKRTANHLCYDACIRVNVQSSTDVDFADVWREHRTRNFGCGRLYHFKAHLAINPRVSYFYYCAHNGHHSVHRHRGSSCLDWLSQANLPCASCQPEIQTSSTSLGSCMTRYNPKTNHTGNPNDIVDIVLWKFFSILVAVLYKNDIKVQRFRC